MAHTTSRRTKRLVLIPATVLMLGGAGAAYAFWSSTGTGTGTAATGTSTAFTVAKTGEAGAITPGGAGKTVNFRVTNPGPGAQSLSSVTVAMADGAGVAWVPPTDCDIAWYTASVTTQPTAGAVAQNGTVDGVATVTLSESGTNQDACKTAVVPLRFAVVALP